MTWASFLGALVGALIGGGFNIIVGEGKRRREEDTALQALCIQVFDMAVAGRTSSAFALKTLEARRIQPRFWKFNRQHARRINSLLDDRLDGLERALLPVDPEEKAVQEEVFGASDHTQNQQERFSSTDKVAPWL